MHIADIDGRKYERQRLEDRRVFRFAAACVGILFGLGVAAIVLVMGAAVR